MLLGRAGGSGRDPQQGEVALERVSPGALQWHIEVTGPSSSGRGNGLCPLVLGAL